MMNLNNSRGVIILCMRKAQYAAAAFNLALSIKFNSPNVSITLLTDGIHNKAFSSGHFGPFNSIREIKEDSVAEAKLSISKYADYEQNLFVDSDSICLQDVNPLFDKLKGNKFKSNVIENYTTWTDESTFKEFFDVEKWQTINSSWIYFEDRLVFEMGLKYFNKGFSKDQINPKWGGHFPDELFFNGALSKICIDAKVDFDVMFFDDKKDQRTTSQITQDYYFITFYGNKNSTRLELQEWYDREMFRLCSKYGQEHRFKIHEILAHKLVNEK